MTRGMTASRAYDANHWVTIPDGPFTIGADSSRAYGKPGTAAPAHTVDVKAFSICVEPVSVREFAGFIEATGYVTTAERTGSSWVWRGNPAVREPGQDHLWLQLPGTSWAHPLGPDSDVANKADHPVTHVSRADCLAYCEWAVCRLPSEAEWEKAARGSDARAYTWGSEPPDTTICNYNMYVGDTTPIGAYPRSVSPFGLKDAAGNVWEWTSSLWCRYPLGGSKPQVLETPVGMFELGVVRGGSFFNDFCDAGPLVYERLYSLLDYTSYDLGFRVCRRDHDRR